MSVLPTPKELVFPNSQIVLANLSKASKCEIYKIGSILINTPQAVG
jgi:hypothetical protein